MLPAVTRAGLPLCVGDVVDIVHEEEREEVVVLGLEPDRDPTLVRLRLTARVAIAPGFEVWPSQTQSHVALRWDREKNPAPPARPLVALTGATLRRRP